jgi:hypothetical protein
MRKKKTEKLRGYLVQWVPPEDKTGYPEKWKEPYFVLTTRPSEAIKKFGTKVLPWRQMDGVLNVKTLIQGHQINDWRVKSQNYWITLGRHIAGTGKMR